jgi:hypothetical protein
MSDSTIPNAAGLKKLLKLGSATKNGALSKFLLIRNLSDKADKAEIEIRVFFDGSSYVFTKLLLKESSTKSGRTQGDTGGEHVIYASKRINVNRSDWTEDKVYSLIINDIQFGLNTLKDYANSMSEISNNLQNVLPNVERPQYNYGV